MASKIILFNSTVVVAGNTWDPANKAAGITLSGGNLTASQASGGWTSVKGLTSFGKTTGKWYFEVLIVSSTSSNVIVGVGNASATLANFCGSDVNGWGYYGNTGAYYTGGGAFPLGNSYTTGDRVMVAFDAALGRMWFGKNGTWQNSGNPAGNTNTSFTGLSGTLVPMFSPNSAGSCTANFGATAFTYSPPSGFTGY